MESSLVYNHKGDWQKQMNALRESDLFNYEYDFRPNHNQNKILKSDWLSTVLISALIGQFNRTVCVMPK